MESAFDTKIYKRMELKKSHLSLLSLELSLDFASFQTRELRDYIRSSLGTSAS